MNFEQEKALLLAENILYFANLVGKDYRHSYLVDSEKWYRLKHLVEEYQLDLLGRELLRLNQFEWEESQSTILIERIRKGIKNIDDYIHVYLEGLFIFSARLYVIKEILESIETD